MDVLQKERLALLVALALSVRAALATYMYFGLGGSVCCETRQTHTH